MARDLSASPWRSAALAPLFAPVELTLIAVVGRDRASGFGGLDAFVRTLLLIWSVAYAYMWLLAVPSMLLTRRWITWSWLRLIALGALLGALPWIVVPVSELRGRADLSFAERVSEALRSLLFMDGYIVPKFAALGAIVAAAFCILQIFRLPAPSNNALDRPIRNAP